MSTKEFCGIFVDFCEFCGSTKSPERLQLNYLTPTPQLFATTKEFPRHSKSVYWRGTTMTWGGNLEKAFDTASAGPPPKQTSNGNLKVTSRSDLECSSWALLELENFAKFQVMTLLRLPIMVEPCFQIRIFGSLGGGFYLNWCFNRATRLWNLCMFLVMIWVMRLGLLSFAQCWGY